MTIVAGTAPLAARRRPWWMQLWAQVLIGMLVGIALGLLRPGLAKDMAPLGDAFIKAIRVLIAPIIFCTVVHGIARMADMAKVGRVALKALVYFEVLTTIALIIGLAAANLFHPGVGMHADMAHLNSAAVHQYVAETKNQTVTQFLLNIIPGSFVGAFTSGNVLQVLFVAVLCGFALTMSGEVGRPLVNAIDRLSRMFFEIVGIVMWAAPIGAFGAMAFAVGSFGAGSLVSLGKLLASFYVTCLIFVFGVLWPVSRWCGFSLPRLLRYIREELLIVFATTSSETVLPRLIEKLEALGCEQSVVGLVVPTGYSFNLDGTCLYLASASIFLAQATDTSLSLSQQIGLMIVLLLTSKGAAGVAGAAFVVLAATLASAGSIPVESVALVLGVHRLMSEGLTPTNLVGNAVATIVVAKWENALDERRLAEVLANPALVAASSQSLQETGV